ncbi:MAG: LuxR family transcriptional regulator [Rhodospirillales bacterium]|nr:LuxR family transcriptional regulator [Rhodospirillales bacterium]
MILGSVVDAIGSATDPRSVEASISNVVRQLGMRCFTYWAVNVPGHEVRNPLVLTDYPEEWTREYVQNGYVAIDPVIKRSPLELVPFAWGASSFMETLSPEERQFFGAAGKHRFRYGIAIPVHGIGNEFSALSVVAAPEESEEAFLAQFQERAAALSVIAAHAHATIRKITGAKSRRELAHTLSKRELECLGWVAQGKSFADIATILGIGRTTVITHVNKAKDKLGVRTSQQAVSQIIGAGLVWTDHDRSSI